MREFICGYQSLLSCTGEIIGALIWALLIVIFIVVVVADARRKRP